jgi:hypothetical protein
MSVETVPQSHLIVTVHGIRTYGHWQERLEGTSNNDDFVVGSSAAVA